ncbi:tyrosine-type recombinase/integrase [Succinivibrio dextrinosolvens]|uniref:tyrosine-type recombinase/integrase n=1 Tax=Succinivibrio dextrinosolvens TaxID=83771 RepID=UPI0024797AF3|nr:site-specific integrase [Succinivibrio dextrinosolvens]
MKTKKQMDKLISEAKTEFEQNPQTMRVYRNIDANLFLKIKRTSIDVLFRKKIKGRIIEITLGNYLNLSIEDIKEKYAEIQLSQKAVNVYPYIKDIKDQFLGFIKQNRSHKRFETYKSLLDNQLNIFYNYRVNEINAPMALELIKKINGSDYTKYSALCALRIILDYVVANYSCLQFNPLNVLKSNPMIDIKKPKPIGYKYISHEELGEVFLRKLDSIETKHALFLLFLAMTALRIGSALELRYSYINKNDMKIIFPADKMKMRREFELPITNRLKNLLKNIEEEYNFHNDVVFYSSRNPNHPISKTTVQTIIKTITNSTISAHSLRKIMRTYLTSIKVPVSIAKMCLAHQVADQIDEIYDKYSFYDDKKNAFNEWHEYVYKNLSDHLKKFLDS